jgi:hypothetical protein
LGDGLLALKTEFTPFAARFDALFGDCRRDASGWSGPTVECHVTEGALDEAASVQLGGPGALDLDEFARLAFPDREVNAFSLDAPWRGLVVGSGAQSTRCAWHGDRLRVLSGESWPSLIGSLAVARTMAAQASVAFLHAGSVGIDGRGVLICGPKSSGKTTLTLGLGAIGHSVLGDEVAAIRIASRELLPFRRAASVRPGPTSPAAARLLAHRPWSEELFADGQPRKRVPLSVLFATSPPPTDTPLSAAVFLVGKGEGASIKSIPVTPERLGGLNLLGASLVDMPAPTRAFKLLYAISGIPCFVVQGGDVEETCRLIESAVRQ